jgi:hypothetical protein
MWITAAVGGSVMLSMDSHPSDGARFRSACSKERQGQLEPARQSKAAMTQQPVETENEPKVEGQHDHQDEADQACRGERPERSNGGHMRCDEKDGIEPIDLSAVSRRFTPTGCLTRLGRRRSALRTIDAAMIEARIHD